MARSRPASAMYNLRDPDLVNPGDRSRAHVRWTNGVRSTELCSEALDKGRSANEYVSPQSFIRTTSWCSFPPERLTKDQIR